MSKKTRLKAPTREQKKIISENKLDWHNWLVKEEDNISIAIVSKKAGRTRVLLK